jgi:hypothetical protein
MAALANISNELNAEYVRMCPGSGPAKCLAEGTFGHCNGHSVSRKHNFLAISVVIKCTERALLMNLLVIVC